MIDQERDAERDQLGTSLVRGQPCSPLRLHPMSLAAAATDRPKDPIDLPSIRCTLNGGKLPGTRLTIEGDQ
jgi:hypothetical protein